MRFKGLCGMVLVGMLAASAHANVFVTWRAQSGFYFSGNSSVGILALGESALAQLIWSPDNVADDANFATPNYVTGNDVWLESRVLTNNGGLYEDFAWFSASVPYDDGGVLPSGGYIYGRIFQNASPQENDWYYVGPVVSALNLNPLGGEETQPDSPQGYNMNRDNINGDAIDGAFGAQVVPEPASISLLVLGAAVLGLRRRRR